MTNQTIEEAVEDFQAKQKLVEPNGFLADVGEDYEAVDFNMETMEVWLRQALQAQRDAGAREAEIKSELQSDSFSGCILRILQDFASIQEPTNKHYLEAATRVSNAALFHANIDGGKVMFNTIEEALTHPTK